MQTIGSTKAEVLADCSLFRFVGGDLVVWGYDPRYEDVIRAKRRGGHIGGKLSGKARLKHSNEGVLEGVLERSGEEGSGEEGNKSVGHAHGDVVAPATYVSGMKADVPSLVQVKEHAAVIGMPEVDAVEFFVFWTDSEWRDRDGAPVRNWKAKMASRKTQNAARSAKEKNGQTTGRRRVADTHYQNPGRPYDGKF